MSKLDPDEFRSLTPTERQFTVREASASVLREMIPNSVTIHPAADEYAMLAGETMVKLVDTIRNIGNAQPIAVDAEGIMLEGRERYVAAILALGRAPETMKVRPSAVVRVVEHARVTTRIAGHGDIPPASAASMLASAGPAAVAAA